MFCLIVSLNCVVSISDFIAFNDRMINELERTKGTLLCRRIS